MLWKNISSHYSLKLREHCSPKFKKNIRYIENRTSSHKIFKCKMTGSNETELNPSQPLGGTDRSFLKHIFTIWLITSCKHLHFFFLFFSLYGWKKNNSKLAYFFLYRLFMKRFHWYKQNRRPDRRCLQLKNDKTPQKTTAHAKERKRKLYSGTIKEHFLMPSLFHVLKSV